MKFISVTDPPPPSFEVMAPAEIEKLDFNKEFIVLFGMNLVELLKYTQSSHGTFAGVLVFPEETYKSYAISDSVWVYEVPDTALDHLPAIISPLLSTMENAQQCQAGARTLEFFGRESTKISKVFFEKKPLKVMKVHSAR